MYMLAIYYYAMCCDIDSMVSLCIIVSFVIFFFLIIIIYHHHFFFFCFFFVSSILSHSRYRPGQIAAQQLNRPSFPSLPFPSFLPSFSVYPCFSAIQHLQKSAIDPVGSIIVIIYNHNMIIVITFSVTTQPKIAHAYN